MRQRSTGPTAARFIEETLALIAELGGSSGVNLREVSRRVGCAHTNVYNYFASFDDLLWAAFRRTVVMYGHTIADGLDPSLPPTNYIERLVENLVGLPQSNPGLYRFIGSDPIDVASMPDDIMEQVVAMKQWLVDTFAACAPGLPAAAVEDACTIVYAYIDGETFNLINQRVVPGEDVAGRIVGNAMRLARLLAPMDGGATADYPAFPTVVSA